MGYGPHGQSTNSQRLGDCKQKNRRAQPRHPGQVVSALGLDNFFKFLRGAEVNLLALLFGWSSRWRGCDPSARPVCTTCRMPRPPMRMRSPFLRCFTTWPTKPPRMASGCFFESSLACAMSAATTPSGLATSPRHCHPRCSTALGLRSAAGVRLAADDRTVPCVVRA